MSSYHDTEDMFNLDVSTKRVTVLLRKPSFTTMFGYRSLRQRHTTQRTWRENDGTIAAGKNE